MSVFCFTCNHVWNGNKIISAAERIPKINSATMNMLENIRELHWACEIISGKFPRAEIKLFRTDVDEGRNNFKIILFNM